MWFQWPVTLRRGIWPGLLLWLPLWGSKAPKSDTHYAVSDLRPQVAASILTFSQGCGAPCWLWGCKHSSTVCWSVSFPLVCSRPHQLGEYPRSSRRGGGGRSYESRPKSCGVPPAVNVQDTFTAIGGSFRTKQVQTGRATGEGGRLTSVRFPQRSFALMAPSAPSEQLLSSHFTSIQGGSIWLVAHTLHNLRAIPLLSLCPCF